MQERDNVINGMTHHYFSCQCSDFGHIFRFVLDETDGEIWLEVNLNVWTPWYARVWHAIRFVFGFKQAYGHFDVTMLRPEDHDRLHALLYKASLIKASGACYDARKTRQLPTKE